MINAALQQRLDTVIEQTSINKTGTDKEFFSRLLLHINSIDELFSSLYKQHHGYQASFTALIEKLILAYKNRSAALHQRDQEKDAQWFLNNKINGMSLYVDRFAGNIQNMEDKLSYLQDAGINFLHLMPLFESPQHESDGGYAVSDFRKVDARFGTLEDLKNLQQKMQARNMYLMLDIVLNHTSHKHEWAIKAKAGDKYYQDYYYMFDEKHQTEMYEHSMPEIFPESAPGNFTYIPECNKWVMTVFHNYQWDINFTNPFLFNEMLDTIFFYANLGVDILRIDAPAFIWKQAGTTCQNLPQAHTILRLIKQCVMVSAPGMALLGEAIVAPAEIMHYFGNGSYTAKECDFAYNATHMALQWDALATGKTQVMMQAQHELLKKPYGTSWITYTRCHDDIGLGYDDYMITAAGFNAYEHRKFLKEYYAGNFSGSPAKGALFSVNPKTQDARISGSLASLCGLEKALDEKNEKAIDQSIKKILLMQAHSFLLGGVPMLFYGDEAGYTNDYSYLQDEGKNYDNRWMHRPVIDWEKNKRTKQEGTIEHKIFTATKKIIGIRNSLPAIADLKNLVWVNTQNEHIVGYLRNTEKQKVFCFFNFSSESQSMSWYAFKQNGFVPTEIFDHWSGMTHKVGEDSFHFFIAPYGFHVFECM